MTNHLDIALSTPRGLETTILQELADKGESSIGPNARAWISESSRWGMCASFIASAVIAHTRWLEIADEIKTKHGDILTSAELIELQRAYMGGAPLSRIMVRVNQITHREKQLP